ncbi:hypothetical protein ABZ342_02100 [Amycolatopsis sp. NPDC005961]|uniref:hypothetical protein n=1 Tax=Amycolatopsis sp. NPDC005961 TaxID=3156720 RepID=UPI0033D59C96
MNAAVVVGVIAASVSIVGWFVSHVLNSRAERRRVRLAAQLAHVGKQLEELYGPLAVLSYEGRASFRDLLGTLGRDYVPLTELPIPQDILDLWLFWVDHDFMPRNAAVQQLVATKSHLIDGGDLPDSYRQFIDHYNSWRMSHERWKQQGIAYSWHSKTEWPSDFDRDVIKTYRDLLRRHAELIGAVARTG